MERELTKIIEKYLEGNYLVGSHNKSEMINNILVLFNVKEQRFSVFEELLKLAYMDVADDGFTTEQEVIELKNKWRVEMGYSENDLNNCV